MKYTRVETVPAKTQTVTDRVECDLCGAVIRERHGHFELDEVRVVRKVGEDYPEGGSGQYLGVDLCVECFMGRLRPWLDSQGATFRREDYWW